MKSIRNVLTATLLTAGAAISAATGMSMASAAEEEAAQQTPPAGPQGWHHRGGPWQLFSQLGLSEAQKLEIKGIMTAARPQMQSLHEQIHANALTLQQAKPTDPNYANIASQVSQTHGSLAAQMLTQKAEVRAQIFKVLTPAQQTQLAALEAEMRAHKHGS